MDGQSDLSRIARYGLQGRGHVIVPWSGTSWDGPVDLVVAVGPVHPTGTLLAALENRPLPLVWWWSEPTVDPAAPVGRTGALADLRWLLARHVPERSASRRWWHRPGGRLAQLGMLRALQRRGQLTRLAVFTPSAAALFDRYGVPSMVVPIGTDQEECGGDLGLERDLDVVFLGRATDPRRRRLIPQLRSDLAELGIELTLYDGAAHGAIYGRDRHLLLNRAKVVLALMRQPWDSVVFRWLLSAPNGPLVLSESLVDGSPVVPGKHLACSSLDQLASAVRFYLDRPEEREAIARCGQAFAIGPLNAVEMAGKLLEGLDG